MRENRRLKLVTIRRHDVLDWFVGAYKGWRRYVELPRIEGVPPDAHVLDVRENHLTRMFEFLVAHPSFEEVPEGAVPPVLPGVRVETRAVELHPREWMGPPKLEIELPPRQRAALRDRSLIVSPHPLEPVGLDRDGTVKPVDGLGYDPPAEQPVVVEGEGGGG